MFLRVNGLFGWIDSNNKRSMVLFAAFLVMFHLLGLAALALPLLIGMPDCAPFTGWDGYARVVMPLLTLVGATVFAVQYFWQTRIVRSRLNFRYVDAEDEPRLCRIAEPLVIAAGIPVPFLALIDDPAMNAFACGVRRADTVIIVTRGLLDGLDDEELAAVLAHEIAHIRDGDIRLMAAANVCMTSISALFMNGRKVNPVHTGISLLGTVFIPPLFAVILALGLVRQVSYWLAQAVRLAIASSREFIADAVAVRLTHNPAALVSALTRIEGHSKLAFAGSAEAMMIDGASEGEAASHPRIAERIGALIGATGNLALEGLTRRGSRDAEPEPRPPAAFGRKGLATPAPAPAAAVLGAPQRRTIFSLVHRIATDSPNNVFGIPRKLNIVLVIWVLLFGALNRAALADPVQLAAKFNPAPLIAMRTMTAEFTCPIAAAGESTATRFRLGSRAECDTFAKRRQHEIDTADARRDGWMVAQITKNHCFASRGVFASGAPTDGYWPLTKTTDQVSPINYTRWAGQQVSDFTPGEPATDAQLQKYVEERRNGLTLLADYYGPDGAAYAQPSLLGPEHAAVLDRLRARLQDPDYVAKLNPIDRAEYRLLVDDPAAFMPCKAKLGYNVFPPDEFEIAPRPYGVM